MAGHTTPGSHAGSLSAQFPAPPLVVGIYMISATGSLHILKSSVKLDETAKLEMAAERNRPPNGGRTTKGFGVGRRNMFASSAAMGRAHAQPGDSQSKGLVSRGLWGGFG